MESSLPHTGQSDWKSTRSSVISCGMRANEEREYPLVEDQTCPVPHHDLGPNAPYDPTGEEEAGMIREQTVFVVDDEADVRAALSMLIRSIGLTVQTFASPQAFLDNYDPDRPGCIVLDVRMPGMSGLDLQEKLASIGLHPPIIMISGHGGGSDAVQASQDGAIDFLQKPFNDQLFFGRIQQALALDLKNRHQQ